MVPINSMFIGKTQNYLHHGPPKLQNAVNEIQSMVSSLFKADYLMRFINSVVNEFQKGKECGDESFIIPPSLFEITKPFIFVEIPYCELNEIKSKHFLKKFHKFTNNSFRIAIMWKTRNIRSLFPLKDKTLRYIGETTRNAEVRWNEHNNSTKSSEPSKHLRSNINHYFTWAVISNAPKNAKTRKNLEASYIALWKPDLNGQKGLWKTSFI